MVTEQLSVFDIFKIGIGPSSSHTLGPWRAAERFLNEIENGQGLKQVQSVQVKLYGSLAKTGKGHGTDIAVILGLSGEDPVTFDTSILNQTIEDIGKNCKINLGRKFVIEFNPASDILFLRKGKPCHYYHPQCLSHLTPCLKMGPERRGNLLFGRWWVCGKGGRNPYRRKYCKP